MTDRSLADRRSALGGALPVGQPLAKADRMLCAARWAFAALGSVAAVVSALLAMAAMVGTWIS